MAYTFKQNMVSSSKYSIKCPYSMIPQYITIHNNEAYLAKNNGYYEYFQNGSQPFSYPNYDIQI